MGLGRVLDRANLLQQLLLLERQLLGQALSPLLEPGLGLAPQVLIPGKGAERGRASSGGENETLRKRQVRTPATGTMRQARPGARSGRSRRRGKRAHLRLMTVRLTASLVLFSHWLAKSARERPCRDEHAGGRGDGSERQNTKTNGEGVRLETLGGRGTMRTAGHAHATSLSEALGATTRAWTNSPLCLVDGQF